MFFKTLSYTTPIQVCYVTSFGFVNKPSSDHVYQDLFVKFSSLYVGHKIYEACKGMRSQTYKQEKLYLTS